MATNDTTTTLMNAEALASEARQISLGLFYRGREYALSPTDTPFVIGRDADCSDLCVPNEYSSRNHCAIEYRDTKFVLRDSSTNGTYLQLGRADHFHLHNETSPLIGKGCFKPGKSFSADDPDLIHFIIRVER